jgi:hypothetical protein
MNATIVEYVQGMPVGKVFNQSVSALKKFEQDVYSFRDLTLHWVKITASYYINKRSEMLSEMPLRRLYRRAQEKDRLKITYQILKFKE